MLAPNKQNLLILKGQVKLVENGLKLLKEKRSGLIYTFLELAKQGKILEQKVSNQISKLISNYDSSMAFLSSQELELLLTKDPVKVMNLQIHKKRISGVYVDELKIHLVPPHRDYLKFDIRSILKVFANFLPIILELSQLKLNTQRMSQEIQKVNRQISNLENKISDINTQIKFIRNALMEKENFEKSVSIKLFN
jgi:vacuolar-type H+-ATPase subunit D/Vma8